MFCRSIFGEAGDGKSVKRLHSDDDDDGPKDSKPSAAKKLATSQAVTDILTEVIFKNRSPKAFELVSLTLKLNLG